MRSLILSCFAWLALLSMLLGCAAQGAHPLAGTRWLLTSLNGAAALPGNNVTLVFDTNQYSGSGGCNSYAGKYQTPEPGQLNFLEIQTTEMACVEPERMKQEQEYFAALRSAVSYSLPGGRLAISDSSGRSILVFVSYAPFASVPTASVQLSPVLSSTVPPEPTATPVTPEGSYATEGAARDATVFARATTSPFPTAASATIQPGEPSRATAARDGLSLSLVLPKDDYLMGEGGRATITIRNAGTETVFIHGNGHEAAGLTILDEQGREPEPWPWTTDAIRSGPPYLKKLAPGESVEQTADFQIPPADTATGHEYVLWVWTRFSRPSPDNADGPDNVWLRLETGPIPLALSAPDAGRRLTASMQADRSGWQLNLSDAKGAPVPHLLFGQIEAVTENTVCGQLLDDAPNREWSGRWCVPTEEGAQIIARARIAVAGYVTAAVTQTVPGTGDPTRMIGYQPPRPVSYSTVSAAQKGIGLQILWPSFLPGGAALDRVEVLVNRYDSQQATNLTQFYRLPDGSWLTLLQMNTTEQGNNRNWGRARWDQEARAVTVGGGSGYLIRQFGRWYLDWQAGDSGFELASPTFGPEKLAAIAASVK